MIDVNLMGQVHGLMAALPHFAQGSGSRGLYTLLRTRVPHRRTLAMAGGGPRWRDTIEPAGSPAPQVSR